MAEGVNNIVTATCPEGYKLLGGGVHTAAGGDIRNGEAQGGSCRIVMSRPDPDNDETWQGQVFCLKEPDYDARMWTFAQCGRIVEA